MKKVVLFVLLLGLIAVFELRKWTVESGPLSDSVSVIIPKGAGSAVVTQKLVESGVIQHPFWFRVLGRVNGWDKNIKAGEYAFEPKVSLLDVWKNLLEGKVLYRRITFAEGLTSKQFLDLIAQEDMLMGEITEDVKEGELLPETYNFTYGDSKNSIVLRAKKAMQNVLAEAWAHRDVSLPLKSADELLILASIVEKETGIASERPLVASVFANRLRKGMRLQTDPSVIYALTLGQYELERSLTRKDLMVDSPYNTYKYFGLPPTPICNPGRDALMAAARPEISDWLYFVASGDGGHNFAKSLREHNKNVKIWRQRGL